MSVRQQIRQHRPQITRLAKNIAHHYHLAAPDVIAFVARVDRAVERNDHELIRSFEERAGWETYLTTIVSRLFFQFRNELWGNWRPSGAAHGLGTAAVLLEELMARDGLPFAEAAEAMRTTHQVDLPLFRIEELASQLGLWTDTSVGSDARAAQAASRHPDARHPAIQVALRDAMALLSSDDRLLVAMHYSDRQPLTRIARILNADPRLLQRQIEQAKEVLRMSLLTQGIALDDVDALLLHTETDPNCPHRKWWMLVMPRLSY